MLSFHFYSTIVILQTILFTDLDDTLFATARKQSPNCNFQVGSFLRDGSISGYLSPKQWQMWQIWQKNALCIPVTARNQETFSRVALPFTEQAIINHGGVILEKDGKPNRIWQKQQLELAEKSRSWLIEQKQHLKTLANMLQADVRLSINHDCGLDLYVLLKSNQRDEQQVGELAALYKRDYLDPKQGYIHCNGNNLAILPYWLGKAAAVNFLITQYRVKFGELLILGFGDSKSDLPFMQLCDYWLTPQGSQIDLAQNTQDLF